MKKSLHRCRWAEQNDRQRQYHDTEWGRPLHDDRALFELLILEGMQAGLSWDSVLAKREHFRRAFDGFVPAIVAQYDDQKRQTLLLNPNIIRNRLKIAASVTNAQAFLRVQQEFGSFDRYLWGFVDGVPLVHSIDAPEDVPASTPLSQHISADLKRRGFRFVGPVIVYAYMQSAGLVNDHENNCFCKQRENTPGS